MFRVIKTEGAARRGEFTCPHGTVQTPVFMNVGTQGAIKGAVSAFDLKKLGCQVELSNTYHLHLRPGDVVVRQMGGLHKFMRWDGPMLTDSGGFQVFSLAGLRKITEEGVTFSSHIDGRRVFMGPEESMRIQSNLGSDIAMAFDECVENPSPFEYVQKSCQRTARWLERCVAEHERLKSEITGLLNQHNDEGKNPNPMAKGMSWIKTNMKIAMDRDDTTVADLITDGCNMGVKSLSRYLNQYKSADTKSRDITGRLVRIEDRLVTDVRQFL